jgi:hypothetical protein
MCHWPGRSNVAGPIRLYGATLDRLGQRRQAEAWRPRYVTILPKRALRTRASRPRT